MFHDAVKKKKKKGRGYMCNLDFGITLFVSPYQSKIMLLNSIKSECEKTSEKEG